MTRDRRALLFLVLLAPLLLAPAAPARGEEGEETAAEVEVLIERALTARGAEFEEAVAALAARAPESVERLVWRLRRALGIEAGREEPLPAQVLIEARFLEGPRGSARALLGDAGGIRVLGGSREVEEVTARLERDAAFRVVHAPTLLALDGQRAEIRIGEDVAYVRDHAVRQTPGGAIAEPVVDAIRTGTRLVVLPTVRARPREIRLEGAFSETEVLRPIPTRRIVLEGVDGAVEIQTPEIRVTQRAFETAVPDGGHVLIGALDWPRGAPGDLIVWMTARVLSPDEVPVAAPPSEAEGDATLLQVDAHFVQAPPALLGSVMGAPPPDARLPGRAIPESQARRLLDAEDASVVTSPRLTVFEGQPGNLSVLNSISYVQDFEVEVDAQGRMVADPIVGTLQEGLVLDVRGHVVDGGRVLLHVQVAWSQVVRPIPDFVTLVGGREVTIQLPELVVSRIEHTAALADGGWLLLGGFARGDEGSHVALLRVRTVALEDPGEEAPPPR